MSCERYSLPISRYLDGELDSTARAALEYHLEDCADCRQLLVQWREQGILMRSFLGRHALGEDFVERLLRMPLSNPVPRPASLEVGWLRRDFMAWLQAAAAILLAIVLAALWFPGGDQAGTAIVSGTPSPLNVWSAGSGGWTLAGSGDTLKHGDWLHTPESAATIRLGGSDDKVALDGDTLAQVARGDQTSLRMFLLHGSLKAKRAGADDLIVETSIGSVLIHDADVAIRMRSLSLPQLHVSTDRSSVFKVKLMTLGGIEVHEGTAILEQSGLKNEIRAGSAGYFTAGQFAERPRASSAASAVLSRLDPASGGSSASSELAARMQTGAEGLRVEVDSSGVSLKQLLAATTGAPVMGGDELPVRGSLSYSPDASVDSIVSAVAENLDLDIKVVRKREVGQRARLPLIPGHETESAAAQEFWIRKSSSGELSFDFTNIRAHEVFRALRAQGIELPSLAAGPEDAHVTLKASGVRPEMVVTWLQEQLGMTFEESIQTSRVIEVGSRKTAQAGRSGDSRPIEEAVESGSRASGSVPIFRGFAGRGTDNRLLPTSRGIRSRLLPITPVSGSPDRGRMLWQVLRSSMTSSSQPQVSGVVGSPVTESWAHQNTVAEVEGRDEDGPVFSTPGRHLIWPASLAGAVSGEDVYYIANEAAGDVVTYWEAYDAAGSLLGVFALEVPVGTWLRLVPALQFGINAPDLGHWETWSKTPIAGAFISSRNAGSVSIPAHNGEELDSSWQVSLDLFQGPGGNHKIWLINPSNEPRLVIIALSSRLQPVASVSLLIAPHAGMLWSPELDVDTMPTGFQEGDDPTFVIYGMNGPLVAGVIRLPVP